MLVRDIMSRPAICVPQNASLETVAQLMLHNSIGCIPVVDGDGSFVGLITAEHFLPREKGFAFSTFRWPQLFGQWMPQEDVEPLYASGREMKAAEVMDGDTCRITEDATVEEAIQLMVRSDRHRLPVLRGNSPVGVVTARDLLLLMV